MSIYDKPRVFLVWRQESDQTKPVDPEQIKNNIAIVIDTLRATTNCIVLLKNGAKEIHVRITPKEARYLKETKFPDALLVGERNMERIEGFDLGNSPYRNNQESVRNRIVGKTIIFSSTNFPKGLSKAKAAARIYIGSIVNANAVAYTSLKDAKRMKCNIVLVLSGGPSELKAREDLAAASLIAKILENEGCILDDFLEEDMKLVEGLEHFAAINSSHAKGLYSKGFGHDVIFSVKNTISVVPEYLKNEDKIIIL
ncbi:MAG: 2-phosphosulfolactate phosphatase [Promethearchaeota archaeon]